MQPKKIAIFFFLFYISNLCSAYCQHTTNLAIANLRNTQGKVLIQILNEKNETVKSFAQKIENKQFEVKINDLLPKKKYAIAIVHDENSNGNIDTNFLGIPKEGYGFSNNPKATFGKPALQEQLFEVNEKNNTNIKIKLIYW